MRTEKTLAEVLALVSNSACPEFPDETSIGVNSRRSDGDTPLHIVVRWGDIEGAKLLIAAGADVNAIGDMGETPLHVTLRRGNEDLVRLLIRVGRGPTSGRSSAKRRLRGLIGWGRTTSNGCELRPTTAELVG